MLPQMDGSFWSDFRRHEGLKTDSPAERVSAEHLACPDFRFSEVARFARPSLENIPLVTADFHWKRRYRLIPATHWCGASQERGGCFPFCVLHDGLALAGWLFLAFSGGCNYWSLMMLTTDLNTT